MIWGIYYLKFNCSIYVFSMLTLQTIADHLCLFWTLSWPTFYQNVYWNIDWSQSGIHLNLCFQDFLWFALHVEHSYLWIFFLLKNLLKIFFMLGGNSVVSCTWGSLGRPAVCMSNWHLECRMYICRDGYKETIVSWWFRNWSTFPYFQVCMQFSEIHYLNSPASTCMILCYKIGSFTQRLHRIRIAQEHWEKFQLLIRQAFIMLIS